MPTAPTNSVAPVVSGPLAVGQTLSTTNGIWTGTTPITYTYQWQLADPGGVTWQDQAGLTGATATILAAHVGGIMRCVVTAHNSGGTGTANSNATSVLINTPSNATTLTDLLSRARSRSDTLGDTHITDAELTIWINLGLGELHDFLVSAYDEILTVVTSTGTDIQIVANQASYALPGDFFEMMGVDYLFGTKPYMFTMSRFMPRERNRYQGPFAPLITGRLIAGVLVPQYRVRNQYIDLIPQPTQQMGLGKMRLSYVKQFANLVSGTDYVDPSIPNGWEEYAVLSAAAAIMAKQERDPSPLLMERAKIEQRITRMAQDRDAGEPMRVVDVNRLW